MLTYFKQDGSMTNFILNVLLLLDISTWRFKQLDELMDMFNNFIEAPFNENRLLLSYNPLMSIVLVCDILTNISRKKRFADQCAEMKADLLDLGKIYCEKIDSALYYEKLIKDTDFKGRSVLSIICYSELHPLMSEDNPTATNLINNIWKGQENTKCNGTIYGYSCLKHILGAPPTQATADSKFFDIVTNNYEGLSDEVDYLFQYKYRMASIEMFYIKECLFGIIMFLFLWQVSNDYRSDFKGPLSYVILEVKGLR